MSKTGKILIIISVCVALTVSMALFGCKTTAAQETTGTTTAQTAAAETTGAAETTASATTVSAQKYKIGVTLWTTSDTFTVQMGDGWTKAIQDAGSESVTLSNEGGKEVDNTRNLISQDVDAAIMCYWDPNLAKTSIGLLNEKNIPVFSIDIPMPGTVFLGVNNYDVGTKAGNFMADWVIKNWGGTVDLVIDINSPTEGPVVAQRFQGQEDAFLAKINYPVDKVERQDGGGWADGALKAIRPILAKHTDAQKIAIFNENDACTQGIKTALEEAGKTENAIIMPLGMPKDAIHLVSDNKMPVIGGIAFFPDKYGEQGIQQLLEITAAVKAGSTLEDAYKKFVSDTMSNPETKEYLSQAIYVKTEVITADNINQFFPAQ
ncbi:MAG: sugar ABC transporter substrate-binding protein [Actinobacteria bacterium]|nr:sugar ABC transporter substrate-binding protein [Actinomycetota bacterium]